MSIGSRIYEIVRTPFVFTAQAADFVIDGVMHVPDGYEQEGGGTRGVIYGPFRSMFESFKDNVAGQASVTNDQIPGDSMVGMALGPKGLIGATVETIPEWAGPVPIRKAASEVIWTPFLDNMQRLYKYGVDRPIGSLATVTNIYQLEVAGEEGSSLGQRALNAIPGDWMQDDYDSVLFDIDTYSDVWNVTASRSAGQGVALSLQNVDIFDPESVQEFENTLYYQTVSGLVDLTLNIMLDPAYLIAKGARINIGLRKAKETYQAGGGFQLPPKTNLAPFQFPEPRPTRRGVPRERDEKFWENWEYRPKWLEGKAENATVDELIRSEGFGNFRSVIRDIWHETLDRTGLALRELDIDYAATGEKGTDILDAAKEDLLDAQIGSQVVEDLLKEKAELEARRQTGNVPDLVGIIDDAAKDSQAPFFDDLEGESLYQGYKDNLFGDGAPPEAIPLVHDVVYTGSRDATSMPDPIFDVPVYHGARGQSSDSLHSYIDSEGYLVLNASSNFDGKVSSVSFAPFKETAMDYGTRRPATGGQRQDGIIFEIDADALGGRQRIESAEEVAINFDLPHNPANNVRIPPDKFRVIDTRAKSRADEIRSMSDDELADAYVADVVRGEFDEWQGVGESLPEQTLIANEIARRFAKSDKDFKEYTSRRLVEIENAQVWETGLPVVRRTNTEKFIDNLALNILRAGNEGRLGPGWKRMADDQAHTWAYMMAVTANGAELSSIAWLPFDNIWRWNLGSDAAKVAFENQAKFLVSLFNDANFQDFHNFVSEYRRLTDEINEIELTQFRNDPSVIYTDRAKLERQVELLKAQRDRLSTVFNEQISLMLNKSDEFLAKYGENTGQVVPQRGTPEFDEFVTQLDQLQQLPWNAILSTKDQMLRTLVERIDPPNIGPDSPVVSRYNKGMDDVPSLVEAATQEILRTAHIPTAPTRMLPYLGASSRLGFSARTFLEKSDSYNELRDKRAVRIVVDKVAQAVINWNNLPHAYTQMERALRDYGRITTPDGRNMFDAVGINPDELLISILNNSNDMNAMRMIWDEAVQDMNQGLVNEFVNVADPTSSAKVLIDVDKVTQILRGQLLDVEDLVLDAGQATREAYTNADFTVINFAEEGSQFHLELPISPSQLRDTSVVPRYDMYRNLIHIAEGDFRYITDPLTGESKSIHIGAAREKVRAVRRSFSTVWKRSVLMTPRWQMVVNIDSMLRTVAALGAASTFARLGNRFDTLQARWLRRSGVDVTGIVARELHEWAEDYRAKNPEAVRPDVDGPDDFEGIARHNKWAKDRSSDSVLLKDDAARWARGELVLPEADYMFTQRSQFVEDADLYNKATDGELDGFVQEIIDREYARGRRRRRVGLATGAGLFFGGPVGAAVAAVTYNKYARSSLASVTRKQIADTYGQAIMLEAADGLNRLETLERAVLEGYTPNDFDIRDFDALTPDEIELLESGLELADVMAEAAKNRREAARLLAARAEYITTHQKAVVDQFKATQPELAGRFDQAAEILGDAGYNQTQIGNAVIDSAWGDTPQLQQVWERVNSSNAAARHLWNEENAVLRKTERYQGAEQYDYTTPGQQTSFENAYNDYLARHATSQGVARIDPHRDFWRQFWLGKTDQEIFEWMQTEGRAVIDDMPETFHTAEGMQQLIDNVRYESNSLVPNTPEFQGVRAQLARGEVITWAGDIEPVLRKIQEAQDPILREIINTRADLRLVSDFRYPQNHAGVFDALDEVMQLHNITDIGQAAEYLLSTTVVERIRFGSVTYGTRSNDIYTWQGSIDFGKTVNSSEYTDALQTMEFRKRAVTLIDEFFTTRFENLSMVEDTISRGTMFEAVYERTVADALQRYRNADGTYTITGDDLSQIQNNARQQALYETKQVLYDLAERSRFEELMTEMMPFLGAWTEVATRWMGLAGQNPVFVARALRPWHVLTAKDENDQTRLVFKLPPVFDIDSPGFLKKLPMSEKLFGPISVLSKEALDLNLGSASMVGAYPSAGPLYSVLATEVAIAIPEMTEFLDWSLPYGYAEGDNMLERFVMSHLPSWSKSGLQQAGLDTNSRAATAVRVSQDYLAQMHENGQNIPDTPEELAAFNEEVERRVKAIYGMRMFRSITVPISYRQQSPYWAIISDFYRIEDEHGAEVADYWLLENHAELWAFIGRKYATKGVVAGTLEGHLAYEKHKDIADRYPELGGFVTGAVGALDVQLEYNRAIRDQELRSGRREYLEPEGILTEAQEAIGWREYRVFRNSLDTELRLRAQAGGSSSLNANSNQDLRARKNQFVQQLGETNPHWWREYNDIGGVDKQGRILAGFREIIADPDFAYRVELPELEMFISLHDAIGFEMVRRSQATNNDKYLRLSYSGNEDLEQQWNVGVLQILQYPDFGPIYDRYFSNMDSISTQNLPGQKQLVGISNG